MMVGSKSGFVKDFKWYFEAVVNLLKSGKRVYFFEGNHDFHLVDLFSEYIYEKSLLENFHYLKQTYRLDINGKKFAFMHGDDLDLDNNAYKRWKSIYSSHPFKFMVNNILPYRFIRWLGHKASNDSRKRNSADFDYEKYRALYQSKAEFFFNNNPDVDVLVAGHTHIKDKVTIDGKVYVNSGFPQKDNAYIKITSDTIEVLEI